MAAFQGDSIFWIETSKIVPNPFQPRREFDETKLKELSESIRMYGVLQPLTVTRKEVHTEDGAFKTEYELIAGERRLRASKLAGLEQVPVIIREGEDSEQEKLELAIIENLQREDLNAVDRALAFKQLADVFQLSHSQVAKKVGRSREYVSNSIRLLNLPDYMLESIKTADITEGHARTLLMLNDRPEEQDTLYRETLLKKLTVREVERIARKIATDKVRKQQWKGTDPELIEKEKQFTETLGTRVQLTKTDYGGKITIDYFSDEDLDLLLESLATRSAGNTAPTVSVVTQAASALPQTSFESDETLQTLQNATPLEVVSEREPVTPDESPEEPAPEVAAPTFAPTHIPSEKVPPYLPPVESTPLVVEPSATPEVVSEPVQQSGNSLRSKLAVLFGQPATETVAEKDVDRTPEPASEVETEAVEPVPEPVVPDEVSEPTEVQAEEKKEADDDLYGMKNFSI